MELVIRIREKFRAITRGQTMTEYALILAAVAVVVFITYEIMGQDIQSMVSKIDTDLSNAS